MNTQINGGPYTCAYCGGCFRERRYSCDDDQWFCLPECLVGYEWYVNGRNAETEEEREQCKQEFFEAFQRTVFPAPLSCYMRTEKRTRDQWLHEECRDADKWLTKKADCDLAARELYVADRGHM